MSDWNRSGQPPGHPAEVHSPSAGHSPSGGYQAEEGYPPQEGYPLQGTAPAVRRVATGVYLALFWGGLLAGVGASGLAMTGPEMRPVLPLSWAPLLLSVFTIWILLYKAWAAIQDGYTRTTPGRALGLLFIPIFNIYWAFVAIGRWGSEFNAFAERHQLTGFRASPGLFIAHCILSLVPGGAVITLFTGTAILVQFCRGINAVADGHTARLPVAVAYPR